jgi:hypothetical protein
LLLFGIQINIPCTHERPEMNQILKEVFRVVDEEYQSPRWPTSVHWGNIAFIIMCQSQLLRCAVCHNTTLDGTSSGDLANKYYPETELKGDWSGNRVFWMSDKAEKVLGWTHHEKE